MLNFYYKDSIISFTEKTTNEIIGQITNFNQFDSSRNQNKSWKYQIESLQQILKPYNGTIFFEFSIPRMGKRVDVILIVENIVFVIEYKVGENKYLSYNLEQVWDYALDLKNFHQPSHNIVMAPILVATEAKESFIEIATTSHNDNLILPIRTNSEGLSNVIRSVITFFQDEESQIEGEVFSEGRYSPTPTIVEAAVSLYNDHTVDEITRSDAEAKNLTATTSSISEIIKIAKSQSKKIICFVTGVPGAGKTLVGLKVATTHLED